MSSRSLKIPVRRGSMRVTSHRRLQGRSFSNLRSLRVWPPAASRSRSSFFERRGGFQEPNFGCLIDPETLMSLARRSACGGISAAALRRVRGRSGTRVAPERFSARGERRHIPGIHSDTIQALTGGHLDPRENWTRGAAAPRRAENAITHPQAGSPCRPRRL